MSARKEIRTIIQFAFGLMGFVFIGYGLFFAGEAKSMDFHRGDPNSPFYYFRVQNIMNDILGGKIYGVILFLVSIYLIVDAIRTLRKNSKNT